PSRQLGVCLNMGLLPWRREPRAALAPATTGAWYTLGFVRINPRGRPDRIVQPHSRRVLNHPITGPRRFPTGGFGRPKHCRIALLKVRSGSLGHLGKLRTCSVAHFPRPTFSIDVKPGKIEAIPSSTLRPTHAGRH